MNLTSNTSGSLANSVNITNVDTGSGSLVVKRLDENGLTPLTFDANFPHDRRAKVNTMYKDAVTLATAGYDATTRAQDPGYLRYFYAEEARYVASTLDAFIIGATHEEGSKIPEVIITWGASLDRCQQNPNLMMSLATTDGQDPSNEYFGRGSRLWICPQSDTLSMLADHDCTYARSTWPRTTYHMLTGGAAFLHEFLHYDSLTFPRNHFQIRDQVIQGNTPVAGQTAYGPYLSVIYRDNPKIPLTARDNDDNYDWMCIESYWRSYCAGYEPLPAEDERIDPTVG